jgi:hypothetical protein
MVIQSRRLAVEKSTAFFIVNFMSMIKYREERMMGGKR